MHDESSDFKEAIAFCFIKIGVLLRNLLALEVAIDF